MVIKERSLLNIELETLDFSQGKPPGKPRGHGFLFLWGGGFRFIHGGHHLVHHR